MHTIDLQQGQGVPPRITAASLALIVVSVFVPYTMGALMLARYLQNREIIAIQRWEIAKSQATAEELAEAVKSTEAIEKSAEDILDKLSEVSSCVDDYVQWSPVLETLARNMPANMVINRLTAKSMLSKKTVSKRYESDKTVEVPFSKRTLVLDISGDLPGKYETAVRDYRNRLKSSALIGSKLKDITASKKPTGAGDDQTVTWTMNLVFEFDS